MAAVVVAVAVAAVAVAVAAAVAGSRLTDGQRSLGARKGTGVFFRPVFGVEARCARSSRRGRGLRRGDPMKGDDRLRRYKSYIDM